MHGFDILADILQHHAFGQFNFQILRLQAAGRQRARYRLQNLALPEMPAGHIDGHRYNTDILRSPLHCLPTGFVQHPVTDRQDQPGLFGDRYKLVRWHQSQFRVLPAQQCLDTFYPFGADVDFRLVVQHQLVVVDSPAQGIGQSQPFGGACIDFRGIEIIAIATLAFGIGHSDIGILDQRVDLLAVIRKHGYTDTRCNK